jgi:hypothetical protein
MLPLAKQSQTGKIKLILASGSARRKFLLETAVIPKVQFVLDNSVGIQV